MRFLPPEQLCLYKNVCIITYNSNLQTVKTGLLLGGGLTPYLIECHSQTIIFNWQCHHDIWHQCWPGQYFNLTSELIWSTVMLVSAISDLL